MSFSFKIPNCKNFKVLYIAQKKDLQPNFDMMAIKIFSGRKFSDSLRVSSFILEEGTFGVVPELKAIYTIYIKNKNL